MAIDGPDETPAEHMGYTTNPETNDGKHIDIFVTFSCKDPLLAKFYRNEFGSKLNEALKALAERAYEQMTETALTMEHFDYDVIDGTRKPRIGEGGQRIPLVPKVKVSVLINGRGGTDRG